MKKNLALLSPFAIFIPLILMILSLISLSPYLSAKNQKNTDIRSKAAGLPAQAGNTLTVCPNGEEGCAYAGGDGIQQAVDAAADGDIIYLKKGRFTRNTATNGKCFVDTRGKSITIKGDAASAVGNHIDGQDDEYGTGVKGLNRVGICISGGNVTLESFQLSHTLNHALDILSGASAVIKNVYIVDIDGGPPIVLRGSSAILVNSFINGQVFVDANSNLAAINNVIFGGQGIVLDGCSGNSQSYQIMNNIIYKADAGISGKCVKNLLTAKISNNVVYKENGGCTGDELCTFPGKIEADPLLNSPVVYNGEGWTYAADMHLKDESPVKGLGMYDGACAAPDSSACQSYISQLQSELVPPAPPTSAVPTSEPYAPPPVDNIPSQPIRPPLDDSGPPITYYLPPTMGFTNPNNPPPNIPPSNDGENSPTPTITPTPKPLIDVAKTIESAKNTWENFLTSLIQFTKTILP